ncbi:DUF6538 domain-containing protein [Bradyrhizobium mercantei]|uniref:DUF6538 domain-containing protein n=1 Tax=Bradyrhizobium mercantei TaxID=1904807 RepID=UPI0009767C4E|nr:DUF6538 domain-containing protein [Bradyrhizobium mercantei]
MVSAASTPERDPDSGIYQFRKRVPEQLKAIVGKSEIKFSLQTRDPVSARILNLEATARLEREWAQLKGVAVETPVAIPVSPDFLPSVRCLCSRSSRPMW